MAIALGSVGQRIIHDRLLEVNRITTIDGSYREEVIWQCP